MIALFHLTSAQTLLFHETLILFLLLVVVTVGVYTVYVLRKKRESVEKTEEIALPSETGEKKFGWGEIGEALARKMRWSRRTEREVAAGDVELGAEAKSAGARGGKSAGSGSGSPLWQRRVLMGDRCQMPRFSGLILYDEAGRILKGNSGKQEKSVAPATTVKDLL